MNTRLSIHEAAERELNDAANFYNYEEPNLGIIFLDEVEKAIEQISLHPQSSPLINVAVRCKLLRRFPYSILYSIKPNEIRILAIASQKRRPFYWRGRV